MVFSLNKISKHPPSDYYGKKISSVNFSNNNLKISFDDGKKISIYDDGQSCCEDRYMRSDDDVNFLIGKMLIGITTKEVTASASDCGEHEICFLEIMTNDGCITFLNHNEHNGCYSGFELTIVEEDLFQEIMG